MAPKCDFRGNKHDQSLNNTREKNSGVILGYKEPRRESGRASWDDHAPLVCSAAAAGRSGPAAGWCTLGPGWGGTGGRTQTWPQRAPRQDRDWSNWPRSPPSLPGPGRYETHFSFFSLFLSRTRGGRRSRQNGSHLFSEGPARRPDPVLIVVVSRGAGQEQAHGGLVLGSHVAEELGGLQHPGSRPPLEQHLFRWSQRHHGNGCRVDRLRDNTASSSHAQTLGSVFHREEIWVNLQLAGQNKRGGKKKKYHKKNICII